MKQLRLYLAAGILSVSLGMSLVAFSPSTASAGANPWFCPLFYCTVVTECWMSMGCPTSNPNELLLTYYNGLGCGNLCGVTPMGCGCNGGGGGGGGAW